MIAVIADIVGSRRLRDRGDAQLEIERSIAAVASAGPEALRVLEPTVGDEFQGLFPDLPTALTWLLLLQLRLPEGIECRFGLGAGEVRPIESSRSRAIQDGPGWWAAREAIEQVHRQEDSRIPRARTRLAAAPDAAGPAASEVALVNAYLLARDHVVGGMGARARRLTYGALLGTAQEKLAADEGITQSAVSQSLARAGAAALAQGLRDLGAEARA